MHFQNCVEKHVLLHQGNFVGRDHVFNRISTFKSFELLLSLVVELWDCLSDLYMYPCLVVDVWVLYYIMFEWFVVSQSIWRFEGFTFDQNGYGTRNIDYSSGMVMNLTTLYLCVTGKS